MNAAKNKCRDLMVGDWITNRHGFPMQITNVGEDYAYATFEGNEGDPWEFDDKDDHYDNIPYNLADIFEKVIRDTNVNPQIVIENLKSAFEYDD